MKTSPPWKTKLLCVLKKGVKRVARQGFRHQLRLGEVPGYPMEHLPVVISEVRLCTVLYVPLIHKLLPITVCDDKSSAGKITAENTLNGNITVYITVQVLVCVLSNGLNHEDWPRVVSDDIHRHLEHLRNRVVTLRGHAEGRTLLPLPLCVERAQPQDIVFRSVRICHLV